MGWYRSQNSNWVTSIFRFFLTPDLALNQAKVLDTLQWDEKLTKQAFNSIDLNKNGLIEYKEFVCLISQKILLTNENILRSIFVELDLNNDGKIDANELYEKFSNHTQS